jgi:hypothetical protein
VVAALGAGTLKRVSPRTTGIVFLVAAVLFAFIYFYEIRGGEERLEAEEAAKRLFPGVEAEAIQSIAFSGADGREVRLARRERGWQLLEPLVFPGDEFAADGMASALADLTSQSVYAEPQAPDVYGLGEGALELRFEVDGEAQRVRIGDKTPMGSNTYASIGSGDDVYAIASFSVNALRKSLDDLRDKRVAHFDSAAIDRIEASWRGGGRVVLARGDAGWRLQEPIEGPADETTVDSLLTDLSFLRATGFEDQPPPDAEVGLDDPEFAVTLTGAAPPAEGAAADTEAPAEGAAADAEAPAEAPVRVTIAVGDPLDDSRLVRSAPASLYRIPAERINDFPRELVAYRFKDLSVFPQADAKRVEIVFQRLVSSSEGDAPLEIVATRGETGWSAEPEDFQPGKLTSLVSELARLRAEDILADAVGEDELVGLGLSPPNALIRVYGEGEEPLADLRIGSVRSDGGIVAQAADNPMVFALAADLGEYVPVNLEAFRNRFRREQQPLEESGDLPLEERGNAPLGEIGEPPGINGELLPPAGESP